MPVKRFTVGVKYCGHCNPVEEGQLFVERLQAEIPQMDVVGWNNPPYDILLVVSACPSHCATRPEFDGPRVEIAAGEVRCLDIPGGPSGDTLRDALRKDGVRVSGRVGIDTQ